MSKYRIKKKKMFAYFWLPWVFTAATGYSMVVLGPLIVVASSVVELRL